MKRRFISLCMMFTLAVTSIVPGGTVLAEEIPTESVTETAAGQDEAADLMTAETGNEQTDSVVEQTSTPENEGWDHAETQEVVEDETIDEVIIDAPVTEEVVDGADSDSDSMPENADSEIKSDDSESMQLNLEESPILVENVEVSTDPELQVMAEQMVERNGVFYDFDGYRYSYDYQVNKTFSIYPDRIPVYEDAEKMDWLGDVYVLQVQLKDPEGIMECQKDEQGYVVYDENKGGYFGKPIAPGEVTVTVIYKIYGSETETDTYSYTITVEDNDYRLDLEYQDDTDKILAGGTTMIETTLAFSGYDYESGEFVNRDIEDYRIECVASEEDPVLPSYVEIVDETKIRVKGVTEAGTSLKFLVRAYEGEKLRQEQPVSLAVVNDYYIIKAKDTEEPQVPFGGTLSVVPELYRYFWDAEGQTAKEEKCDDSSIEYKWYYDSAKWHEQPGAQDGKLPALIRDTGDYAKASIFVVSKEVPGGISKEVADAIPWLDYDFDLEYRNMKFPKYSYTLLEGKPCTLALEGVPEGNYKIKWTVNYGGWAADDEMQVPAEGKYVNVVQASDGKSITLTSIPGTYEDDDALIVQVDLYYGTDEKEQSSLWSDYTYVNMWKQEYGLEEYNSVKMQRGDTVSFSSNKGEGYLVPVYYVDEESGHSTNIINPNVVSSDESIVKVEKKAGETYDDLVLHAVGIGEADILVTGTQSSDPSFDPAGKEFRCHVIVEKEEEEYYFVERVQVKGPHTDGIMLPGETMQIKCPGLKHYYYNPQSGYTDTEMINPSEYLLSYTVEDEELISVAADGTVTGRPGKTGYTTVNIIVALAKNPQEIIYSTKIFVLVEDEYDALDAEDIIQLPELGSIAAIELATRHYSVANPSGSIVTGVTYKINNYYTDILEATIQNGSELLLKRKENSTYDYSGAYVYVYANQGGKQLAYKEIRVTFCAEHEFETETRPATCTESGKEIVRCAKCGYVSKETPIPATGHRFGEWKTVSLATTEAPEKQQRTCTVCGAVEEQTVGEKLTPGASTPSTEAPSTPSTEATGTGSAQTPGTESAGAGSGTGAVQEPFIELNATSIPMKLKQSTKVIKVKMAEGDSIVSWESSNKKVVTVTKKGKIKAKKKGKATITVTLASGKTASFVVKVQKNKVTTKKVTGVTKKITLAKGKKYKLTPVLKPLTSQDKITYTSSNKKVATVDKKGNIQAKGKGTAKITVKSGKKKAVCTVTVK